MSSDLPLAVVRSCFGAAGGAVVTAGVGGCLARFFVEAKNAMDKPIAKPANNHAHPGTGLVRRGEDFLRVLCVACAMVYMDSGAETPSKANPLRITWRVARIRSSRASRSASDSTKN